MVRDWLQIEDNPNVIDANIDKVFNKLENREFSKIKTPNAINEDED